MGSGETPTQRTGDEEVKINLVQSAEEDICLQIWMLFGQQDVVAKWFPLKVIRSQQQWSIFGMLFR